MYIGAGIFLLVVGAILAFALTDQSIGSLDMEVIGWICMAGGALAIVLSLVLMQRRPTGVTRTTEVVDRRDVPPTY